jgi:hypothetical protein
MLVAVSIFGVIAVAVSTFAVQSSVATSAAIGMRDAEMEAMQLVKLLGRDYVARATTTLPGTFPPWTGIGPQGVPLPGRLIHLYNLTAGNTATPCPGAKGCRVIEIYVGDDYYASRFGRPDLSLQRITYAMGCGKLAKRYESTVIPTFCGLTCPAGTGPVVTRTCELAYDHTKAKPAYPPGGLKGCPIENQRDFMPARGGAAYAAQRALAVGLCLTQTKFALDVEVAAFRATGGGAQAGFISQRSLNASLPVEPSIGGDIEILP